MVRFVGQDGYKSEQRLNQDTHINVEVERITVL